MGTWWVGVIDGWGGGEGEGADEGTIGLESVRWRRWVVLRIIVVIGGRDDN